MKNKKGELGMSVVLIVVAVAFMFFAIFMIVGLPGTGKGKRNIDLKIQWCNDACSANKKIGAWCNPSERPIYFKEDPESPYEGQKLSCQELEDKGVGQKYGLESCDIECIEGVCETKWGGEWKLIDECPSGKTGYPSEIRGYVPEEGLLPQDEVDQHENQDCCLTPKRCSEWDGEPKSSKIDCDESTEFTIPLELLTDFEDSDNNVCCVPGKVV